MNDEARRDIDELPHACSVVVRQAGDGGRLSDTQFEVIGGSTLDESRQCPPGLALVTLFHAAFPLDHASTAYTRGGLSLTRAGTFDLLLNGSTTGRK